MRSSRNTVASPKDDPYGGLGGTSSSSRVSFTDAKGNLLAQAAGTVTDRGHALVLSRTSDGGALSIGVLHDGLVTKFYSKSVEELDGLLSELTQPR